MYVQFSSWMMEREGVKGVEVTEKGHKQKLTALFIPC